MGRRFYTYTLLLLAILIFASFSAHAQDPDFDNSTDPSSHVDPILQYRPPFSRSLPVQILLTGVVVTLVSVLFIHLIFTAQYHYSLAPVNYVLQMSGVTTLLISLIATLHVVLQTSLQESKEWPYMLSYIAVNVPPQPSTDDSDDTAAWSTAERALWVVMNASTLGLIQITHIQFLTLLYPSRLEGQLIFSLLAPLAMISATMQFIPLFHVSSKVISLSSAVRNVCNATLSLLFAVSLLMWGLLVNRRHAWRTDGGTAAFGAAALVLALVSTALNFLYVPREEEYVWLPGLMWAVVLWQSFLGWWWWVGAGSRRMGRERIEEVERSEERKERKRERQRETRQRAKATWKGVSSALHRKRSTQSEGSESPQLSEDNDSAIESTISQSTRGTLPAFLPAFVHIWYARIQRAHVLAARAQAAERSERLGEGPSSSDGWGLGRFHWRKSNYPCPKQLDEPDADGECANEPKGNENLGGIWWWGPLGRWRLQDRTVY